MGILWYNHLGSVKLKQRCLELGVEMKQCKNCEFYDEKFDELEQSDVEIIGSEAKEVHFCPLFPDGIPNEIVQDERDCEYRVKRK